MRTDSRHLSLTPGAHAAFEHLPLAASPQKVPPDTVGAEVVRFVPLKQCTLWQWGVRPEKYTHRGESQHKNRAVPQNERGMEVMPGWGLGRFSDLGFSHRRALSPEANRPFRRFLRGTTRFLYQNPSFRMHFLEQLGFCATAPPSSQAPPATPKTPYSPPRG